MTFLAFCFLRDRRGATAIEYGLIAALVAVAVLTCAGTLGSNLSSKFNEIMWEAPDSASNRTNECDNGIVLCKYNHGDHR